ncbi:MAG TPA: hypothetical protein VH682_32375 [Gemmataceae bacterium]|jgi:hypothetical protein
MGKAIVRWGVLLTVLLVPLAIGCGGKKQHIPTAGTVTLDGQPLGDAAIVFVPETPGDEPPRGHSKDDGAFSLGTDKATGAPPGTYKVVVNKFDTSSPTKKKQSLLPSIYSSPKTTPLRCTVPHDGPVLLELKKK